MKTATSIHAPCVNTPTHGARRTHLAFPASLALVPSRGAHALELDESGAVAVPGLAVVGVVAVAAVPLRRAIDPAAERIDRTKR